MDRESDMTIRKYHKRKKLTESVVNY